MPDDANPSRRTLGKLLCLGAIAAGIKPLVACTYYVCDGERIRRATDGQLHPNAAAYFTVTDQRALSYTDELADLVNEVWTREFARPINKNICLEFVNQLDGDDVGEFERDTSIAWSRLARRKELSISIRNILSPAGAFLVLSHELGHQYGGEDLAEHTSYRLGTLSSIHFPQFGADTNYLTFALAHGGMLNTAAMAFTENKEEHGMGALAALLALNHHHGSFAQAHDGLLLNGATYRTYADRFVNYCNAQPPVDNVVWNDPDDITPNLQTTDFRVIATYELWNIVAHQLLETNVQLHSALDAATKAALIPALKQAMRYPRAHTPANPPSDNTPGIAGPSANHYKDGFAAQLQPALAGAGIPLVVPQNYDLSIPKGL